jgi:hypothetical protein
LVLEYLEDNGVPIYSKAVDSDLSIVIGGKFENPIALKGKRVLFYDKGEWGGAWPLFGFIATAYYDEVIDLSNLSSSEKAGRIREYIEAN